MLRVTTHVDVRHKVEGIGQLFLRTGSTREDQGQGEVRAFLHAYERA